jgi:flagellar basal-body rod protein FlgB
MIAKLTILNHTSIPVVAKGLDASTLRGRAIANNMANITTPGYQRIEVAFEEQLKKALSEEELAGFRSDPEHMRSGRPEIEMLKPVAYRSEDQTLYSEVNNVDIDEEASKLAENEIMFSFDVRFLRDRFDTITSASRGRI